MFPYLLITPWLIVVHSSCSPRVPKILFSVTLSFCNGSLGTTAKPFRSLHHPHSRLMYTFHTNNCSFSSAERRDWMIQTRRRAASSPRSRAHDQNASRALFKDARHHAGTSASPFHRCEGPGWPLSAGFESCVCVAEARRGFRSDVAHSTTWLWVQSFSIVAAD